MHDPVVRKSGHLRAIQGQSSISDAFLLLLGRWCLGVRLDKVIAQGRHREHVGAAVAGLFGVLLQVATNAVSSRHVW